jgi:FkbM family methyltransferase
MSKTLKDLAKRILRRLSQTPFVSTPLYRFSNSFVKAYRNFNYDFESNGERWLLNRLPPAAVIFDVGANHGDWLREARKAHPNAVIHAFEVMPTTFEILKRVSDPKVKLNPFGLSDQPGKVQLYSLPKSDGATSLVPGAAQIHRQNAEIAWGEVTTGLLYVKANNISRIDLLKIDVEGAEHLVLKGFDKLHNISIVQFEYGMQNIYSRFLLRDFYELLSDFEIGKLYPNGVDFRPYHALDEDFLGPNFVAVNRQATDLLRLLRRA